MTLWKGMVGMSLGLLALGGALARADDLGTGSSADVNDTTDSQSSPTTPAPGPRPLMWALDGIGVGKVMEAAHLSIYGYVEGGYLYDSSSPNNITPPKSAPLDFIYFPGDYKNDLMLNQVDLAAERSIDATQGNWDIGFKIEGLFGRDAFYTHSSGILDSSNKAAQTSNTGNGSGNEDQYDVLQAYVSFAVPVGGGLNIYLGKFVDPVGVETIDPTNNMFYTHSYGFAYGRPFTLTGGLFEYHFIPIPMVSDWSTFTVGMSRGWNQTLYDNNGVPDGIFQVKHHTTGLDWTVNAIIGPEGTLPFGPSNNHDWWAILEGNLKIQLTDTPDQCYLLGDFLLGNANHVSTWINGAVYFHLQLERHVALNYRIEYYHDGNGATTSVGGSDVNFWETTLGLSIAPLADIKPFQFFTIRPEIRFDWANSPIFDAVHWTQTTASVDMVWKF